MASGIAVVRGEDGTIVQCNPRFRELAFAGDTSASTVKGWLAPGALVLEQDEHSRYLGKQPSMRRPSRPCVGVTVSRLEDPGCVLLEVVDSTAREPRHVAASTGSFVHDANMPAIGFDSEGRITEWNACITSLVGATEEEMLGKPLGSPEIVAAHCLDRVKGIARGQSPGLKGASLSLRIKGDLNATLDLVASSWTRTDAATGKPAGGYILGQDLTQFVVAKTDAVESAGEARAERNLNEYMAHEMRNPLFAAQAAVRFLTDFIASPAVAALPAAAEASADVRLVAESINDVAELLSGILDLNKFLDGKLPFAPCHVRIAQDVVHPAMRMMRTRRAQGVALSVDLHFPGDLVGLCDATRVKQVLVNLVGNALRFTSVGFVRVVVSYNESMGKLMVRVEDSGAGVPSESTDRVFKRFAPAANHDQGCTLGLHLARQVVEKLGGKLWLDKNYDSGIAGLSGSRFCFLIPFWSAASDLVDDGHIDDKMAEPSSPAPSASSTSTSASASTGTSSASTSGIGTDTTSLRVEEESKTDGEADDTLAARAGTPATKLGALPRGRLLLVDDDEPVRAMMVRLVSRALPTFTVEEAANGEAAMELLDTGRAFDVIVMDQHMSSSGGKMLGTETIRAMREQGVDSLIVGFSGNDIFDEYAAAGADLSWSKPMISTAQLRDRILAGLSAQRGRR